LSVPAREKLGAGLRAARRNSVLPNGQRGLTGVELAARLGVSQGTISKVENGKHLPDIDLVRRWVETAGAADEVRSELLQLAEQCRAAEVTDWRSLHARGWANHQRGYADLERGARSIHAFQNALVPGLLQTAGYTTYLLEVVLGLTPEQVAAGVQGRLARQQLLYERGRSYRAIVTEAVLRHRLGGPAIMAEQLHRLADLSRLPTVELGVIPSDTDMPSRYGASFDLFEGLDGSEDDLVVVELEASEVRESAPERVEAYRRRFATYWSAALTGTAAADLVQVVAQQMESRIFE
jgi:transcriptional regulator with XRE-family HTH domain